MEANQQLTVVVYSIIMLAVNDVFVRYRIMKLKYILTPLFAKYNVFNFQNIYVVPIDNVHYFRHNLEMK